MSEESHGPYHGDKCAECNGPDAAYIVNDRQLCWKHAKAESGSTHIPQTRNPVGTRLKIKEDTNGQ